MVGLPARFRTLNIRWGDDFDISIYLSNSFILEGFKPYASIISLDYTAISANIMAKFSFN